MEVEGDNDVLRALAQGGEMDYEQWPSLLSRLIPRLEKIVNEEFPAPSIPSLTIPSSQITTIPSSQQTTISSPSQTSTQTSTANKENAPPPVSAITLPPQILILIASITSTLTTLFSTHPPHTIQRLAELLLEPKAHYRTLPSYLHALDRVVHVSSGAHIFPLPPAIPDPSSAAVLSNGALPSGADPLSISWGNPATTPLTSGLGSDESLGGALLTPISWLTKSPPHGNNGTGTASPEVRSESTEMIDGPNGPGGVETVSVSVNGISSAKEADTVAAMRADGGVTQGELLRQEQRAGVVPAAQLQKGDRGNSDGLGEDDDIPHARGPEEIGAEDIGGQEASATERSVRMGMQGIDVEAALGRRIEVQKEDEEEGEEDVKMDDGNKTPKREADEEMSGDEKRVKDDEDTEIKDADEKTEEETTIDDKTKTDTKPEEETKVEESKVEGKEDTTSV